MQATALALPSSRLCSQAQCERDEHARWCARMNLTPGIQRKQWEFVYIAECLDALGLLRPGSRGLGFGVGQEPLPALFARAGCDVLATDLPVGDARLKLWRPSHQHAATLDEIPWWGICDEEELRTHVQLRPVDMNAIPADLRRGQFDFAWSASALDHLGSLAHGLAFIRNSLECVRPGGVVVHTTEYNVRSNAKTLDHGDVVVYRRRDLEALAGELRGAGHYMTLDLTRGDAPYDMRVAHAPYDDLHLNLELGGQVLTSIGLCVVKGGG